MSDSPAGDSSKHPTNIIFVCIADCGQFNIVHTVIHHLLSQPLSSESPPLYIHLFSWNPAQKRADELKALQSAHQFSFHTLGEPLLTSEAVGNTGDRIDRHPPPSFFQKGGLRPYQCAAEVLSPPVQAYLEVYNNLLKLVQAIRPVVDLAVLDVATPVGADVCEVAGIKNFGFMAPNGSIDLFKLTQPWLKGLWKYPALFSDIPYPIPMRLLTRNIFNTIGCIYAFVTHPRARALDKARKALGFKRSVMQPPFAKAKFIICASVMEMEWPHTPPKNAMQVGPILQDEEPLSADAGPEKHRELAKWLDRDRTIVINMGSLFTFTEKDVEAVLDAFVQTQKRGFEGKFQILWKLKGKDKFAELIRRKVGKVDSERIRVEEWIEPPALATLQHRNVVALVNHGGANSMHEAAYVGIPQIILPQWLDLYDIAQQVSYHKFGIYANQGHPAEINATKLSDAFVDVLRNEKDQPGWKLGVRAKEVSDACRNAGGLKKAAEIILTHARAF